MDQVKLHVDRKHVAHNTGCEECVEKAVYEYLCITVARV